MQPEPEPESPPPSYPDIAQLEADADMQSQSLLFRLPFELRHPIYEELWTAAGSIQHVLVTEGGKLTHLACVTDHKAPDDRQTEIDKIRTDTYQFRNLVWARRLISPWGNHWKCQEALADGRSGPTPFLAMLLACKRT
jgi:hypothetical protein